LDDDQAKAEEDAEVSADPPAADSQPSVMDTTPWLERNPLKVDVALLEQGQQQFDIYCAVCHGMNGRGNGLVNQRAQAKGFDTWVPPASLHQETLYAEKYPDGKLFSTISNGIRKMSGYASQIKLKDRWAIVAYVRALQLSQNAPLDAVPNAKQSEVKQAVKAAQDELKRQAEEAERKAAEREKNASK